MVRSRLKRYLRVFVQSSKNNFPRYTIELKSSSELEQLRISGQMIAKVLRILSEQLRPGITTKDIDDRAYKEISSLGAKPAFLGYRGYPATACVSINHELVHGIPSAGRIIKEGDIVSIDLGLIHNGFYGDVAGTFPAGKVSPEAQRLMAITSESLERAIAQVKPGNRMGDIGWAVQSYAEQAG